ncbi:RNAligase [Artemisia annua]|uniref:RNAligase n=1 Tax=Artemisia annua TaxID=35608 RepID=A0A2U1LWV9_ARTAN|nr:RNAligase [Artemisia annua]
MGQSIGGFTFFFNDLLNWVSVYINMGQSIEHFSSGYITDSTLVWAEGQSEWQQLSLVPGLINDIPEQAWWRSRLRIGGCQLRLCSVPLRGAIGKDICYGMHNFTACSVPLMGCILTLICKAYAKYIMEEVKDKAGKNADVTFHAAAVIGDVGRIERFLGFRLNLLDLPYTLYDLKKSDDCWTDVKYHNQNERCILMKVVNLNPFFISFRGIKGVKDSDLLMWQRGTNGVFGSDTLESLLRDSVKRVLEEGIHLYNLHTKRHGSCLEKNWLWSERSSVMDYSNQPMRTCLNATCHMPRAIKMAPFELAVNQVLEQLKRIIKGAYVKPITGDNDDEEERCIFVQDECI